MHTGVNGGRHAPVANIPKVVAAAGRIKSRGDPAR
jgi:hypothetical protein